MLKTLTKIQQLRSSAIEDNSGNFLQKALLYLTDGPSTVETFTITNSSQSPASSLSDHTRSREIEDLPVLRSEVWRCNARSEKRKTTSCGLSPASCWNMEKNWRKLSWYCVRRSVTQGNGLKNGSNVLWYSYQRKVIWKCHNYQTISLISHTRKVMPCPPHLPENMAGQLLAKEQAGFRQGRSLLN